LLEKFFPAARVSDIRGSGEEALPDTRPENSKTVVFGEEKTFAYPFLLANHESCQIHVRESFVMLVREM
jgi:hypothetical protein